jgi:OmcA/MtrC family decaheme c-type cytochrome
MWLAPMAVATFVTAQPMPAAPLFQYNIVSIRNMAGSSTVAPGQYAVVRFSVTNPQTGAFYNLATDPAWTAPGGASRLFLQIGWDTRDFTNTNSNSNLSGGRGAALPIPVNALTGTSNGDGTYSVTAPQIIPFGASGTGTVAMEGHPAGPDATGALTVRVPVRSVFRTFLITGTALVARRQIVDNNKCMVCHKSDGTGVAPQLTLHGSNRTEEVQVCVMCHNPNNTDIAFRNLNPLVVAGVSTSRNPTVRVGSTTYPEQSIDFKRMIHGIHASTTGFRRTPFVAIVFGGTYFDASTLKRFPTSLSRCAACHIDSGGRGTFELPLAATVLGSTMNTGSTATNADGSFVINTDPSSDVKISPIAAACSSCHDDREVTSHMVSTGGASFNTTQAAISSGAVRERCVNCHGVGKEESVRRAHD